MWMLSAVPPGRRHHLDKPQNHAANMIGLFLGNGRGGRSARRSGLLVGSSVPGLLVTTPRLCYLKVSSRHLECRGAFRSAFEVCLWLPVNPLLRPGNHAAVKDRACPVVGSGWCSWGWACS